MLFNAILIVCFAPALLVFGFVKIFKKQLAQNPTKNMIYKYVLIYSAGVIACLIAIWAISRLF